MQPRKDLSGWTGRFNSMKISPWWFDSRRALICFRVPLFSLHFVTRYFTAVFRISLYTWHVFTHAASAVTIAALYQCYCCSCRCCSLSCDGWQKLLLVHWIWFHPVAYFSSFGLHLSIICVPLGSTGTIYRFEIPLLHPRYLCASAEPERTSARRGNSMHFLLNILDAVYSFRLFFVLRTVALCKIQEAC